MWKIPACDNCEKHAPVMVMLKDELWLTIAPHPERRGMSGILCFNCIELRLGRRVTLMDLKPCGITDDMMLGVHIAAQTPIETGVLEIYTTDPAFHLEKRNS